MDPLIEILLADADVLIDYRDSDLTILLIESAQRGVKSGTMWRDRRRRTGG